MKYFEKRKIFFQNLFDTKKYIIVYNKYYYILIIFLSMNCQNCVKMTFNFLNYILLYYIILLYYYILLLYTIFLI